MDTITHGLLGAAVAQLGFRQRIGRDATWAAIAAGVAPDLDILLGPLLTLTGTEEEGFATFASHRGITHSLLMIPLATLALTTLWWWFKRSAERRRNGGNLDPEPGTTSSAAPFWLLYLCVLAAMVCHPVLDACTTYGTQLLSPLTNHRYAVDAVPIVDIIYTPLLILTLVACYVARKTIRNSSRWTRWIGGIGLGLSFAYLALGLGFNQRILKKLDGQSAQVAQAQDDHPGRCAYHAYPQLGTALVWRVTRQCPGEWSAGKLNVLFGMNVERIRWNTVRTVDNEWVRRARELAEVRLFEWFTLGQMRASYARHNLRHMVEFYDMRYGPTPDSLESLWSVRVTFDELTRTTAVERVQHHRGATLGQVARRALTEIGCP